MKRILAVIRSERQTYKEMTLVLFGLALLFSAMEIGGIILFKQEDWVPLSVVGTSTIGTMGLLLISGLQFALSYNRALRYGVTRKKAMLGAMGTNLVLGLIFWAAIAVAVVIEVVICYFAFFSEMRVQQVGEFLGMSFTPLMLAIVAGTLVTVMIWGTICGVLLLKFGKAVFWGWYAIFFGGMFLITILEENAFLNRLISKIPTLSPVHWAILAGVVVVALLVYAVRTAFRLEVMETFG